MKPSSEQRRYLRQGGFEPHRGRIFPITDNRYQAFSLDRFYGGPFSAKPNPSFLNISREYFRYEARRNFLAEAAFFLALVVILALTFISGALVIIHFLQLPEA